MDATKERAVVDSGLYALVLDYHEPGHDVTRLLQASDVIQTYPSHETAEEMCRAVDGEVTVDSVRQAGHTLPEGTERQFLVAKLYFEVVG